MSPKKKTQYEPNQFKVFRNSMSNYDFEAQSRKIVGTFNQNCEAVLELGTATASFFQP